MPRIEDFAVYMAMAVAWHTAFFGTPPAEALFEVAADLGICPTYGACWWRG